MKERNPVRDRSAPGLAVVDMAAEADGAAHVGRLLFQALRDLTGSEPLLLELRPSRLGRVSLAERVGFAWSLALAQVAGGVAFLVFGHLGCGTSKLPSPGTSSWPSHRVEGRSP